MSEPLTVEPPASDLLTAEPAVSEPLTAEPAPLAGPLRPLAAPQPRHFTARPGSVRGVYCTDAQVF